RDGGGPARIPYAGGPGKRRVEGLGPRQRAAALAEAAGRTERAGERERAAGELDGASAREHRGVGHRPGRIELERGPAADGHGSCGGKRTRAVELEGTGLQVERAAIVEHLVNRRRAGAGLRVGAVIGEGRAAGAAVVVVDRIRGCGRVVEHAAACNCEGATVA